MAQDPESSEGDGPEPPKSNRLVALVGGPLGGLALGAGIAAAILWASTGLRDATHRFLGALRDRDDGAAYAMLTRSMRARVPEAEFSGYVDRNAPHVRQSTGEWINGFSSTDDRYCMDVWLTPGLFGPSPYVLLVEEDGAWRVDEITERQPAGCADDD